MKFFILLGIALTSNFLLSNNGKANKACVAANIQTELDSAFKGIDMATLKSQRYLLVEDNVVWSGRILEELKRNGITNVVHVLDAGDARFFFDKALKEKNPFKVVFMDHNLGFGSIVYGNALAKEFKSHDPNLIVFGTTGDAKRVTDSRGYDSIPGKIFFFYENFLENLQYEIQKILSKRK